MNEPTVDSLAIEVTADMRKFSKDLDEAKKQADILGKHVSNAIESALSGSKNLREIFRDLALNMSKSLFQAGIKPLQNGVSDVLNNVATSLFSNLKPYAKGGILQNGRATAFAKGGVVNSPTLFGMQGGTGLMGEAGPEAIMPLVRGADGKLGVQASQGSNQAGPVSVVMNITTPDAASFAKSENQIAMKLARAVGRGRHGL
jgi:phage-related minor tail protein